MHWSLIITMAVYKRGIKLKITCNSVLKSFTCDLRTAFKYLDELYVKTEPVRRALMENQQVGNHSSDNYNCKHKSSSQVGPKAGLYHTGMVYSLIQIK